jgi:hypothetical protein
MYTLTEAEYLAKAESNLRQIFVHDDPFTHPFRSSVIERLLIAPYKYVIEPPLISAVLEAASSIGDEGCYLSLLWRDKTSTEPAHWYIPLAEFYDAYVEDENHKALVAEENPYFSLRESAIYSPQGKWGIILTHECFGLLGGTAKFLDAIRSSIPKIEQQVFQFLEDIKNRKERCGELFTWVRPLLIHIYGDKLTNEMLIEAGLVQFRKKGIKFLI